VIHVHAKNYLAHPGGLSTPSLHQITTKWWLGGSVGGGLDTRPKGPRFNAQPMRYQVTTLGKLFTLTYLCRCKCL